MQFETWKPIYLQILDDFGFSSHGDVEAAELLADLLRERSLPLSAAREAVAGRRAVVCGNAPTLDGDLQEMKKQQELHDGNTAILAADGATSVLLQRCIVPDIVVTDLDGPFQAIFEANRNGSIIVVHAHGDNLDALVHYVPKLERVIGTVQCLPPAGLQNFGGFTDGDRCVFLAKELGAAEIVLKGFCFDDESVTPRKRKKLAWAKRLIDLALSK